MTIRWFARPVVLIVALVALAACGPASTAAPSPTEGSLTPPPTRIAVTTPVPTTAHFARPEPFVGPLPEGALVRLGQGLPRAVMASPDGALVAVGTSTGVLVYDAATLDLLWSAATTEGVSSLDWSHESGKVAAGLLDGRVMAWAARSGLELLDLASDDGQITTVDWTPDGLYLVYTAADGPTTVRDGVTGELLHRLVYHDITTEPIYNVPVTGVLAYISPDGRRYATNYQYGGGDGPKSPGSTIVIWDVASGAPLHALEIGDKTNVSNITWSPDSLWVANGSRDFGVFGIWQSESGDREGELFTNNPGFDVYWSPDGRKLFANMANHDDIILDTDTGEWLATITAQPEASKFLGWSPDSKRVTLYEGDDRITTYDAASGDALSPASLAGGAQQPRYFEITGPDRDMVKLWDVAAGEFTRQVFQGTQSVFSVAWASGDSGAAPSGDVFWEQSPGGWRLAINTYTFPGYWMGGCIDALFMTGDKDLADVSCPSERVVSPDGTIMAIVYNTPTNGVMVGQRAGVISIHDYKTGARLKVLRGHASYVTSVAFSPDSTLLASSSDDGTVIVWDMAK